ncbi:lipopolysaccharide biosynthesis protein [Porphyromonas sp.]|uniref:lipopolysaccharide biosynthesis protein n=1 Tax=Porphyromonas sp. TaxID=1924944 RepID=UPI0025DED12C|nr:lipopolysaccharide biosynthesis protein [Porphyromonas sp.]
MTQDLHDKTTDGYAMPSARSQRIARNTLFLFVRMAVVTLLSLYISRVLLAALGVEDFGIYQVVGSLVTAFGFINGAMVAATQRFYSYELGRGNDSGVGRVYSVSIVVQLLLVLLVCAIAIPFGLWYVPNKLVAPPERLTVALWIYFISLGTFVINMLLTPFQSLIVSHERMNLFALLSIVDISLRLGAVLLLKSYAGDQLLLYPILLLTVSGVMALCYVGSTRRLFRQVHFRWVRDRAAYREILAYSGWNLFGNLAAVAQTQGINIVYNYFFGPLLNAAFGIVNSVRSTLIAFANNYQMAANPQIIKSYAAGEYDYLHKLICASAKISYLLMLCVVIPFALDLDLLLRLWLVKPPEYASLLLQLTLIVLLIESLSGALMTGVQATGRVRTYQVLVGSMIIMILPLSMLAFWLGAPPEYSVYINIVVSIVCLAVRLVLSYKYHALGIGYYLRRVVLPILPPTTVVLLGAYLYRYQLPYVGSIWGLLVASILLGGLCTVVILTLSLTTEEKRIVKGYLHLSKRRKAPND